MVLRKNQFKSLHASSFNIRSFNQYQNTLRAESNCIFKIFLSHSHLNQEEVRHLLAYFDALGGAYVDWNDSDMPRETSGETAFLIKRKIIVLDKFIFLATNESLKSRWCNWEIGIADPLKTTNNMAIFPLYENDGSWIGNEFLYLYPHIEYENSNYVVVQMDKSKMPLQDWVRI